MNITARKSNMKKNNCFNEETITTGDAEDPADLLTPEETRNAHQFTEDRGLGNIWCQW